MLEPIPTPYDSRIEGLQDALIYGRPNETDLSAFLAKAEGYRHGYANALAEAQAIHESCCRSTDCPGFQAGLEAKRTP